MTEEKLYQWIEKEHMEQNTGKTISDEEWEQFVNDCQDAFADAVSLLAIEWWSDSR